MVWNGASRPLILTATFSSGRPLGSVTNPRTPLCDSPRKLTNGYNPNNLTESQRILKNLKESSKVSLEWKLWTNLAMFLPLINQLGSWWILTAGHFDRDLHGTSPYVTVVLGTTDEWVPGGTVGRPVRERRWSRLTSDALVHSRVVGGVSQCQMLEHVIIRCQWNSWTF